MSGMFGSTVFVLAVGRAFCGWVCPVPLLDLSLIHI